MIPVHWDAELAAIESHARHLALAHKATATLGVAVDDERKRDYFVPRLQKMLDDNTWARHLTFRVVPLFGGAPIDITASSPGGGNGSAACR
jgi:hypothetical protein